jgi:hypothetical protein
VPQLPSMPWHRGQPSPAISRRCASPFRCRSLILISFISQLFDSYLWAIDSTPSCEWLKWAYDPDALGEKEQFIKWEHFLSRETHS